MCVNISKVNMFQHSKVSPGLDPAAILASVMMMNLVFVAIKYEIHDFSMRFLKLLLDSNSLSVYFRPHSKTSLSVYWVVI